MKILMTSTGLALVLGLGLAPAYAAGDTAQEAGTAVQTETEAQPGAEQQMGTEQQMGAEQQTGVPESEVGGAMLDCDQDGDGFVSAEEASTCAGQQFGDAAGDQEFMTEDQFGGVMGGEVPFSEIDQDGDGQISREEWIQWRDQGFAEATQGSEGRMPSADYDTWHRGSWVGGETGGAGADTSGGTTDQQGGASSSE